MMMSFTTSWEILRAVLWDIVRLLILQLIIDYVDFLLPEPELELELELEQEQEPEKLKELESMKEQEELDWLKLDPKPEQ